jgi:hypothetical protein
LRPSFSLAVSCDAGSLVSEEQAAATNRNVKTDPKARARRAFIVPFRACDTYTPDAQVGHRAQDVNGLFADWLARSLRRADGPKSLAVGFPAFL